MESLDLPMDIFWDGKHEPLSPSQTSFASSDEWLNDYSFANDVIIQIIHTEERNAFVNELLAIEPKLADDDQWLDEKIDLPVFEDIPILTEPIRVHEVKERDTNTEELLLEFESVLLTHLTPPQTPPQQLASVTLQHNHNYVYQQEPTVDLSDKIQEVSLLIDIPTSTYHHALNNEFTNKQNDDYNNILPATPHNIAREMEIVEEVLRSRSQDLPDWMEEDDSDSSDSTSLPSFSPRSESPYSGSNFSQDDEWMPQSLSTSSASTSQVSSPSSNCSKTSLNGVKKKRTRPYARGVEDKKVRKKEQNKNAATRYRRKKKQEIEKILDIERGLITIHDGLQIKCNDLKREIKCLKSLMRDIYKAKIGSK